MAKTFSAGRGVAAKLEGMKDLQRKVNDLIAFVDKQELLSVLMQGGIIIADNAERNAPVDTGNLRASVFSTYGKQRERDKKPSILVGVSYSKDKRPGQYAPYAHIIEFGMAGHTAQPFFRPAVTGSRAEVVGTIADGLREIIRKTVG